MVYIKIIVAYLTMLCQLFTPIGALISKGGEKAFFEKWSPEQQFTEDYAASIKKRPGKDFTVLNLTDLQMVDKEEFGPEGELAKASIKKLVEMTDPDLITLSGDNAWDNAAYMDITNEIDSYGIPWAPVMGNHDGGGCVSEFWCAYQFANAENCLFKFGPENMGYGNYIINVTENGQIIHTLFMVDTHSDIQEDNINGKKNSGYDHLWANQLEWYRWAVNGIAAIAGKTVESTVIMHIPVYEYRLAWNEAAYDADTDTYQNEKYADSFGKNCEGICCPPQSNGFFALCKELGSTKNIIAGHDHINDSSIMYDGIRLSYSLKCGSGGYWINDMHGASILTVTSDGVGTFSHVFLDQHDLGFDLPTHD